MIALKLSGTRGRNFHLEVARCNSDMPQQIASRRIHSVSRIPLVTSQYLPLCGWHVLRYIAQHPLLALLNILSVALGVAVYLATQIAAASIVAVCATSRNPVVSH